jgi:hypothetical protein
VYQEYTSSADTGSVLVVRRTCPQDNACTAAPPPANVARRLVVRIQVQKVPGSSQYS